MDDSDAYEVFPDKAARVVAELNEPGFPVAGCLVSGCISKFVVFFSVGIYYSVAASRDATLNECLIAGAVAAVIVGPVSATILRSKQRKAALKDKAKVEAELFAKETEKRNREALSVTETCRRLHREGLTLAQQSSTLLSDTRRDLSRARDEFAANAFGTYWDKVESAVNKIGSFKESLEELAQMSSEYRENLSGRRHNFPAFPVNLDKLPSPAPVLRDLAEVARMGQTNYQFASIWEQRRTRAVLIKGFENLGDAVVNLGSSIFGAVSDLGSELGAGLQELASQSQGFRLEARQHSYRQHLLLEEIHKSIAE